MKMVKDNQRELPNFTSIIRAHQLNPLLLEVIEAIKFLKPACNDIIVVDSSKNDVLAKAMSRIGVRVARYDEIDFNYSKAINIGVNLALSEYILIISSHLVIKNPDLIADAFSEMQLKSIDIAYWDRPQNEDPEIFSQEINKHNFSGRNGISNSITLIPTHLVKNRPFREEVFSAEDQEWTKYYFEKFDKSILRIVTDDIKYLNPKHGGNTWSELKVFNEELAIGHFVNRRLIMPDRILMRLLRGVLAIIRLRPQRAKMHFSFAAAMLMANFRRPQRQSRYF